MELIILKLVYYLEERVSEAGDKWVTGVSLHE